MMGLVFLEEEESQPSPLSATCGLSKKADSCTPGHRPALEANLAGTLISGFPASRL